MSFEIMKLVIQIQDCLVVNSSIYGNKNINILPFSIFLLKGQCILHMFTKETCGFQGSVELSYISNKRYNIYNYSDNHKRLG